MLARLKFDITDLVNEILDHIPDDVIINGTVLDPAMGGGQFVKEIERRKRLAGKTDQEISETVFGYEENILRRDYAVNKYDLKGKYIVGNFLERDFKDMKFDVIVGNPPFQDQNKTEKGGTTLWSRFVAKSIDLVEEGGYIGMITPNAWMGFGKTGKPLKPYQLHTVYTNIEDYFPNVGSTFTAWILEKTPIYKETNFIDEGVNLDLRNFNTLPVGRPLKGLSIIEKVMNKGLPLLEPKLEKSFKGGWSARQEQFINGCDGSLTKTKEYCYEIFHTNSLNYFVKSKPTDYNVPKIITSVTSPTPKLYMDPIGCAAGDLRCYITVADEDEGNSILSYLNSKLYRFVWRRPGMISWNSLEVPKLSNKIWTDTELYKFFGLTKDEIKIVENYKL